MKESAQSPSEPPPSPDPPASHVRLDVQHHDGATPERGELPAMYQMGRRLERIARSFAAVRNQSMAMTPTRLFRVLR